MTLGEFLIFGGVIMLTFSYLFSIFIILLIICFKILYTRYMGDWCCSCWCYKYRNTLTNNIKKMSVNTIRIIWSIITVSIIVIILILSI